MVNCASVAGLVLDGWAFDPANAHQAATAVSGVNEGLRMLRPVVHMAVSSAAAQSGG